MWKQMDILNHLARHASVRQHVVCMGGRFRRQIHGRIQLFPKTMGDWLSGTSGWKYPNQYESWIGYESKNRLADSHPTSLHLAPGFTRPRGLMPPVKDPGHHLCCHCLFGSVSGYHMSHANTCHMLSDITFVCGERLDDTLKTIPKKFFGTFLLQRDFFQKLWSWPTSPQPSLPGFSGSNGLVYRELIEAAKPIWLRSNLRLAGELKLNATVDVSGCFFFGPEKFKNCNLKKQKWYGSPMEFIRTFW